MIETIKEQVKEIEPKLIIGLIPCLNTQLMSALWEVIKPHISKFASDSEGEYTEYDVWRSVYFGQSFVYFSYLTKDEKDIEYANRGDEFANIVALRYLGQKKEKEFCGFVIVRIDEKAVHIWNAYLSPEYQNTNLFEISYNAIEKRLSSTGAPGITFSSHRKGWGEKIKQIGFKEVYTTYRKFFGE